MSVAAFEPDGADAPKVPGAHIVCTLAEGHYFHGVAALTNSLVRAGFKGTLVVGYRGARPHWLDTLKLAAESDSYLVAPQVRLQLLEVGGAWHLNNCKPEFIRQMLFERYPHAELVYYFDTDIVIKCAWEALAAWAACGVLTVLDAVDSYMSPHHVYRNAWRRLAAQQGRTCRDFTGYVNGGCVGISRAHAEFAAVWSELMDALARDGATMQNMKNATGGLEFSRMDQDVLNATIMATDIPIALLGSEAMGMFPWFGEVMPHAMWHKKPWKRNYIVDALRGFPPGRVHLAYWEFVDGPIRPFSHRERALKRIQVRVGHLIGLLHTRSYRDI